MTPTVALWRFEGSEVPSDATNLFSHLVTLSGVPRAWRCYWGLVRAQELQTL